MKITAVTFDGKVFDYNHYDDPVRDAEEYERKLLDKLTAEVSQEIEDDFDKEEIIAKLGAVPNHVVMDENEYLYLCKEDYALPNELNMIDLGSWDEIKSENTPFSYVVFSALSNELESYDD